MTKDMKWLMAFAYCHVRDYHMIMHKNTSSMSMRFYVAPDECISITTSPEIGEGKYLVRYCIHSHSYFAPSPKCAQLDKLFGRKRRDSGSRFVIVSKDLLEDVLLDKVDFNFKRENEFTRPVTATWYRDPAEVVY